jgi:transposase
LRTALGDPLPPHASARILRILDRLDLVCAQITELERGRDAVLEKEAPDRAEKMIQQLVDLRGIGVQSATVLVREAFVREFANGKRLGSPGSPRRRSVAEPRSVNKGLARPAIGGYEP